MFYLEQALARLRSYWSDAPISRERSGKSAQRKARFSAQMDRAISTASEEGSQVEQSAVTESVDLNVLLQTCAREWETGLECVKHTNDDCRISEGGLRSAALGKGKDTQRDCSAPPTLSPARQNLSISEIQHALISPYITPSSSHDSSHSAVSDLSAFSMSTSSSSISSYSSDPIITTPTLPRPIWELMHNSQKSSSSSTSPILALAPDFIKKDRLASITTALTCHQSLLSRCRLPPLQPCL